MNYTEMKNNKPGRKSMVLAGEVKRTSTDATKILHLGLNRFFANCKSGISAFSDVFYFKNFCLYCKAPILKSFSNDYWKRFSGFFCESCFERLIKPSFFEVNATEQSSRCFQCGRPLVSREKICTECLENPTHFEHIDRIISLFPYEGWGKNFLINWKIHNKRALAYFCMEVFSQVLKKNFPTAFCVPVPPRRGKIKKKGWDQMIDVSNLLKTKYDFTVINCLKRNSCFEQKKLDRLHRFTNMKGIISYVGKPIQENCLLSSNLNVAEKTPLYNISQSKKNEATSQEKSSQARIEENLSASSLTDKADVLNKEEPIAVILDDVITTGATLDSCAEVLKAHGFKKVYGLTLFYD